jgi:prevent-host-death family protein
MSIWKLEDAKNKFSEVVRKARTQGPQLVTKHGREAVVVIAAEEYRELSAPGTLVDFLLGSPFAEAVQAGELHIERDRDLGRETQI